MTTVTLKTTYERLLDIQQRIDEAEQAQTYNFNSGDGGNRSATRGNLDSLYRQQALLETKYEREQNGGVGIESMC